MLPSLALFITLPLMLRQGFNFYLSLGISMAITITCYGAMLATLKHIGVEI